MIVQLWNVLSACWVSMLLGTGLVLVGTYAGWGVGHYRSFVGVRLVSWWLTHVIVPLLRSPSWWRRAATIFINNTCVLSVLLAAGALYGVALLCVAGLGVSLGIALKRLIEDADELVVSLSERDPWVRRRMRVGIALNMLEPPAIVATLGLCLGQRAAPISWLQAWQTYAIVVVPAMLLAACGEALWLGSGRLAGGPLGSQSPDVPPPPMES